jgi:hypothetical protein
LRSAEGHLEVAARPAGLDAEQGVSLEVIRNPQDGYTRLVLDTIPNPFVPATR